MEGRHPSSACHRSQTAIVNSPDPEQGPWAFCSGRQAIMRHSHQQLGAAIAITFLSISSACTVLELQQDGFATNAMYLLHALPIFSKQNGTFFLDSSAFPYTCNEGSGLMDFFLPEDIVVPW